MALVSFESRVGGKLNHSRSHTLCGCLHDIRQLYVVSIVSLSVRVYSSMSVPKI